MAQLNHYLSEELEFEITKIAAKLECSRQDVFRIALLKAYPHLAKCMATPEAKRERK